LGRILAPRNLGKGIGSATSSSPALENQISAKSLQLFDFGDLTILRAVG
jgi:hypothetical protein